MLNIEFIINILGVSAFIAAFCLGVVLLFKTEQIKRLKFTLDKLRKSFDELDEQAKLIVKTDLELNKTQEELDKKVSGLYTLQRLSRAISTTLDEVQIFERIEESLVMELGFEKALAFALTESKNKDTGLSVKMQAGYGAGEIEKIQSALEEKKLLSALLQHNAPCSSLTNAGGKLKKTIEAIKAICSMDSFISSPITTKDGTYGIIIMGNESSFSVFTEGDEEIVAILANQLGQAIENAKLFEETFRSHQELERRVAQRTKELTNALERIKQNSRRKSEFVSAVSHELRTPLTSIKGYASILAAGKLGKIPEEAKQRIEKINRHSNELTELINNLLDISRIESGRIEMKITPLNLSKTAEAALDLLMPQAKEKDLQISLDLAKDLSAVLADNSQLERVFINLIGNAIKYTPEKGKITISAKKTKNNHLQIDISDTGYGIPQEDVTKVFNEFYRADSSIAKGIKGTGLGLSLVKYIIEAHQGEIWAISQINKGSTFSFTLPTSQD